MAETDVRKDLAARDPLFAKGLPTILICSDSAVLPTGLARVVRGIFTPLHKRGHFALVQHGWFHAKISSATAPWPIIPVRRNPANEVFFSNEDKLGQQSFDSVVEQVKPDIVFVVGDAGTFDHILDSKHRSSFICVTYLPLDVFPPTERWIQTMRKPNRVVYYTKFAQTWGEHFEAPGDEIPHGVDVEQFSPAAPDIRRALRQRLFKDDEGLLLVGTVGRNQPRKRHPLFIEAVAHLRAGGYSRCTHCQQIVLHTYQPASKTYTPPDLGTCPRCLSREGLTPGKAWPQLKGYLHSDPSENPLIPLPQLVRYWGLEDHLIWNPSLKITQSHGIPDTQLTQLYQCFDLYVHCASGGGWELPPMEAAACGVPVVAVDAPAQNEYLREMPGCSLVPGETQWDHTAMGYRVFASCADLVRQILVYLEIAPEAREEIGRRNREFVLGYKWEDIALRWEALFHQLLEPKNRIEPWRLLQEV